MLILTLLTAYIFFGGFAAWIVRRYGIFHPLHMDYGYDHGDIWACENSWAMKGPQPLAVPVSIILFWPAYLLYAIVAMTTAFVVQILSLKV